MAADAICGWFRVVAVLLATIPGMATVGMAGGIETLVMPGELVEGHAKYEASCSNCHKPFSKDSQSHLCRDCHEKVDADINRKEGFHGRGKVSNNSCSHCHTDHQGRDADIVRLGKQTFNHDNTDYLLEGAHAGVVCGACHAGDRLYREAPGSCVDCHRDDDAHRGEFGETCADCHDERDWKKSGFNHDDTDFGLHGKHAELECNSCHAGERYEDLPTNCNSCHRLDDVHAGRFGNDCADCHSESEWTRIQFDHDSSTDFPLQGGHREVQCGACHDSESLDDKPGSDCISCHLNDDDHQGRYGRKCESCHVPKGWAKVSFDHDAETEFPLRGGHRDAGCESCHRGDAYTDELAMDCYSCHVTDDVHKGQQGKQCQNCHAEEGWDRRVRFDHDMASFPLLGLHAVVPCEECHLSAAFREVEAECTACHRRDDIHEQQLGEDCESCHNPNAWTLWEFDHDAQSDFQLQGAHAGLDCLACHNRPVRKNISLSMSCGSCHRNDDVHDGRFGKTCERCHNVESFDDVELR